jgi:2,4-dienoyl-CoA reductase (NADPH2)
LGHPVRRCAEIGGQFNLARRIPGKEEFSETLRYFDRRLQKPGVTLELGRTCDGAGTGRGRFRARRSRHRDRAAAAELPGIEHEKVISYVDLIEGYRIAGERVAIIGAGGIGFDVAEFLTHTDDDQDELERFQSEWGIDPEYANRGGLKPPTRATGQRQVWLLQRKAAKVGDGLAKTTGWIRRTLLKKRGVQMLSGVTYERIDDAGLHIVVDGQPQCLPVEPRDHLRRPGTAPRSRRGLRAANVPVSLIGGADVANELDAKRAIDQGTRLAATL